jgi:uncharacterized membrane protein
MAKVVVTITILALISPAIVLSQDEAKQSKKPKAQTAKTENGTVSFKKDVQPLLKKYCMPCHSEEQMNPSEFHLDSYDMMMEGGKHGKPVVPGKAEESILIQKLSDDPPFGEAMPLKAKRPLSEEELKVLVDWINQGAKKN